MINSARILMIECRIEGHKFDVERIREVSTPHGMQSHRFEAEKRWSVIRLGKCDAVEAPSAE